MKIKRDQKIYDHDLAEQGLRRSTNTEWIDTVSGVRPLYREIVVEQSLFTDNRTPWWQQKPARRRKK
jgi:hypothetical protein